MADPSGGPKTFNPAPAKKPVPATIKPSPKAASGGPSTPRPRPTAPPAPAKAAGPVGPWWSRMWVVIVIAIALALVVPPLIMWTMGSFDPALPAPKPYSDTGIEANGMDIAVTWALVAVPLLIGAFMLFKRAPVVITIVLLAIFYRIARNLLRTSVSHEELFAAAIIGAWVGLVAGFVGQFIYSRMAPQ